MSTPVGSSGSTPTAGPSNTGSSQPGSSPQGIGSGGSSMAPAGTTFKGNYITGKMVQTSTGSGSGR